MALSRFKGISATFDDWMACEKVIPEELWIIVHFEDTGSIGLKMGCDQLFTDTPWIFDPRELQNKLAKPETSTPSANKFLAETGDYIELEGQATGSIGTISDLLALLAANDYDIVSAEEKEFLEKSVFKTPSITGFFTTSVSGDQVALNNPENPTRVLVPTGFSVSGSLIFNVIVTNPENIASLNILDVGSVNPYTGFTTVDIDEAIVHNGAFELGFVLHGTDVKGTEFSRTFIIQWTPTIIWGCGHTQVISSLDELVNPSSLMSSIRQITNLQFLPSGQQYAIIAIPAEIPQDDINIVDVTVPGLMHSFNMSPNGTSQTISSYQVIENNVTYNIYVSYFASQEASSANIL